MSRRIHTILKQNRALVMPVTMVVAASDSLDTDAASYSPALRRFLVCDGINDQEEIQAAIGSGERHVVLLEGHFSISAPIELRKGLWISGQGIYGTYVNLANGANCNVFQHTTAVNEYFIEISDLSINGNKTNNASGVGIHTGSVAGACVDVYFHNIFVTNCKQDGIYLYDPWGSRLDNMLVEYCEGNGITVPQGGSFKLLNSKIIENDGHGVYLTAHNSFINNCELRGGNGFYALFSDFVSAIVNSYYTKVTNCRFTHRAGMLGAIYMYSKYCTITGNVLTGSATPDGILLHQYSDKNIILGNYIEGFTNPIRKIAGGLNYWNLYYSGLQAVFMDILAETNNSIVNADDLTVATPHNTAIAGQPDAPRNLRLIVTGAGITECTVWVYGVPATGSVDEVYEEVVFAGPGTLLTNNAFALVTRVSVRSVTGAVGGDTLDVGIGSRLGLTNPIYIANDVYKVRKNNDGDWLASSTVNATYNTVDVSTGGAIGGGDDFTIWFRSNLNIA